MKRPAQPQAQSTPKARSAAAGKSKPARDAEYIGQRNQINAIVMFAVSILMVCLVLITGDQIWLWCHNVMLGLFGSCAIIWPVLLFYISIL